MPAPNSNLGTIGWALADKLFTTMRTTKKEAIFFIILIIYFISRRNGLFFVY